jgi:ribosome maturation factor RimP
MAKVDDIKAQVTEVVDGTLASEGCELADITLSRYRTDFTVRVFVYAEQGVTLDMCARLSQQIGAGLDGAGIFKNGYALEVSSPGLDRALTTERDFRFRIGETVKVEFVDSKRKKLTAEIVSATQESVMFRADSEHIEILLAEIDRARIVF